MLVKLPDLYAVLTGVVQQAKISKIGRDVTILTLHLFAFSKQPGNQHLLVVVDDELHV